MNKSIYFGDLSEVTECCNSGAINHDDDGTPYCPVCGKYCSTVFAEQSEGHEMEPLIHDESLVNNETMDNNITSSS